MELGKRIAAKYSFKFIFLLQNSDELEQAWNFWASG